MKLTLPFLLPPSHKRLGELVDAKVTLAGDVDRRIRAKATVSALEDGEIALA